MNARTGADERRVLHVTQAILGVAYVVEDYVRSQVKDGWQVYVACPDGMLADSARDAGAEVRCWPASREPRITPIVREWMWLRRIVRETRPDVVHLHSAKAGLIGRLVVRATLPTVYSPHAWSWLAATGPVHWMAQQWERFSTRWTDVICSVSDAEMREGQEAGVHSRYVVFPNDVDIIALRTRAPLNREQARERLGVPRSARLAVCVARLSPQKGQDVLLQGWRGVRDGVPGAELCLVGDGPDRPTIRAMADQLPGVTLVGPQSRELSLAWMTAADVVVMSSRYEGMALVPLEAGALGRAVVSTDVEGVREGGFDASRTIVPVNDVSALSAALISVLGDDVRRWAAEDAARARADLLARQERSSIKVHRLYDQLLRR